MSERRFTGDEIDYLCTRCVQQTYDTEFQRMTAAMHQFIGSGTVTSATLTQPGATVQMQGTPKIAIRIRSDSYRFTPLRDITAFEATRIMSLLIPAMVTTIAPIDLDSWWDEAGPSIWRHFTSVI